MKEKNTKNLTKRQEDFCFLYVSLGNESEAARLSGNCLPTPRLAAAKLLECPAVKGKIEVLKKAREKTSLREKAIFSLLRIALSDPADAFFLLTLEEGEMKEALKKSELLSVAEIKKPKGGGVELKFIDRVKALETVCKLCENEGDSSLGAADLIKAVVQSAREPIDED